MVLEQTPIRGIIVDEADAKAAEILHRQRRRDGGGAFFRGRKLDRERNAGSQARHRLQPDFPVHQFYQAFADRKAEPRAAVFTSGRAVGLRKSLKHLGLGFLRQADPGIDDLEPQGDGA